MRQYILFQSCSESFEVARALTITMRFYRGVQKGRQFARSLKLERGRGWYEAIVPTMVSKVIRRHPPIEDIFVDIV